MLGVWLSQRCATSWRLLSFLEDDGGMDAGMAYAELLGVDGGGTSASIPGCDAGLAPGAPSTQCACASRVVPADVSDSYLINVLSNALPANCRGNLLMPIGSDGGWAELPPCSMELIVQWVTSGGSP